MPPGRSSWLARRVGLARSRQLLRRSLELDGTALAAVISRPLAVARVSR
ncbi:MAG TPA: hypothetical protein VJ735_15230 [Actinomycetes bacterium]|nr:hypothetical protein [Actinomycetes bacterium]